MGIGKDEAATRLLSPPIMMCVNDVDAYEARFVVIGFGVVDEEIELAGDTNGMVVFRLFDDFWWGILNRKFRS